MSCWVLVLYKVDSGHERIRSAEPVEPKQYWAGNRWTRRGNRIDEEDIVRFYGCRDAEKVNHHADRYLRPGYISVAEEVVDGLSEVR